MQLNLLYLLIRICLSCYLILPHRLNQENQSISHLTPLYDHYTVLQIVHAATHNTIKQPNTHNIPLENKQKKTRSKTTTTSLLQWYPIYIHYMLTSGHRLRFKYSQKRMLKFICKEDTDQFNIDLHVESLNRKSTNDVSS